MSCSIPTYGEEVTDLINYIPYKQFTISNGLPSNCVYRCAEDVNGNVWCASEGGLIKYNGYTFEVFESDNGLPSTSCFGVSIDGANRIWPDLDGYFGYFFEDVYHEVSLPISNNLNQDYVFEQELGPDTILIKERYRHKHFVGFISANGDSLIIIDSTLTISDKEQEATVLKLIRDFGISVFHDRRIVYHLSNDSGISTFIIDDGRGYFGLGTMEACDKIICSVGNVLGLVDFGTAKWDSTVFDGEIRDAWLDCEYLGLVSTSKGIHLTNKVLKPDKTLVSGVRACGILETSRDELWIATQDDGIIVIHKNFLYGGVLLPKEAVGIQDEPIDSTIWLLTADSDLFKCEPTKGRIAQIETGDRKVSRLFEGPVFHMPKHYGYDSRNFTKNPTNVVVTESASNYVIRPRDIISWKDGEMLLASVGGLYLLRPEESLDREIKKVLDVPSSALLRIDTSKVLVASDIGLLTISDDGLIDTILYSDEALFPSKVRTMTMIEDKVLLGLGGKGVYLLEIVEGQAVNIDTLPHISLDIFYNDGNLLYTVQEDDLVIFRNTSLANQYDVSNSIVSISQFHDRYIRAVFVKNGNLIIALTSGVLRFRRSKFLIETDVKAQKQNLTLSISRNQNVTDKGSSVIISPGPNQIRLNFKTILFDAKNRVEYHFRISTDDQQGEWNVTKQTSQDYFNLSPGKYKFEVKSVVDGYLESRHTEFIYIIVEPHLWQTLAFQIGAFLLVLLLISGAFYLRLRAIRNREEERREVLNQLNNLKMQALQSQMNPHFIFNSLTSIQISIDNGDVEPAKDYLTKFARLLRRILESSRSGKIVLREEIELLEWYIKLETSRFNGRITYEINAENVDVDLLEIPPMIIQPYVENAIHHGLEPKQGEGHLKVLFAEENDHLKCEITDNGVGRSFQKTSNTRQQYKRKSVSMSINQDRLELMGDAKGSVQISDLVDSHGNPSGTTVILELDIY